MPVEKIDVESLAKQAEEHADRVHLIGGIRIRRDFRLNWQKTRDAEFARLVMEECAKVCSEEALGKDIVHPDECAEAIRARKP